VTVSRITSADTTDASPITQPTDRSIPPAIITNVWPRPINKIGVMATKIFCELRIETKPVPSKEKKTINTIKNSHDQILLTVKIARCSNERVRRGVVVGASDVASKAIKESPHK